MSTETLHLQAMTWDHIRGYDPMVVTSQLFSETHPGVEIQWHKRSLQAFADRPLEDMADRFDLMVIDHPHVGEAAATGLLAAFDNQGFDQQLSVLAQESVGVSYPSYRFNNQLWALPIDAAAPIAVYRPDLLDRPPSQWNEIVKLAEKGQLIWPLKPINALMSYFNLLANIGEPFGANDLGADRNTSTAILNTMLAVCQHIPQTCFAMDPIEGYELLSCRSSHSYMLYAYGYSNYSRDGFRPHLVRATNVPSLGNNGALGSAIGGTGIAISSQTKHYQLASEYALWIASAECQKNTYFNCGGQPANSVAWENDKCNVISHQFFNDTRETLERAYLRPRHKGYMAFQDQAGDIVWNCLVGKTTSEQASDAINQVYDKSLES